MMRPRGKLLIPCRRDSGTAPSANSTSAGIRPKPHATPFGNVPLN